MGDDFNTGLIAGNCRAGRVAVSYQVPPVKLPHFVVVISVVLALALPETGDQRMMTVPLGDRRGRRRGFLEDESAMAVGITISSGVLLLLLDITRVQK